MTKKNKTTIDLKKISCVDIVLLPAYPVECCLYLCFYCMFYSLQTLIVDLHWNETFFNAG